MIRDAEIRRIAGAAGVEPRIVELDYALRWALRGIAANDYLSRRLLFKGGTCLRKCYFPDHRFSEDLDFTATEWFGRDRLRRPGAEGEDYRGRVRAGDHPDHPLLAWPAYDRRAGAGHPAGHHP